jgi:hypothetical protein
MDRLDRHGHGGRDHPAVRGAFVPAGELPAPEKFNKKASRANTGGFWFA